MNRPHPRRVTVTRPRAKAVRAPRGWLLTRELDEQTSIGELYIGALVRAQLRLGLFVAGVLGVLVLTLPVVMLAGLDRLRVYGIPVAWSLLCVVLPALLFVLARWYTRRAERIDRAFVASVVDDS